MRRWPKAAAVTRSSGFRSARRVAGRPGRQPGHRRGDLGRRHEGGRRHVEQAADLADMLGQHRQPAVVLGARRPRPADRRPPSGTSAPCRRCRRPRAASAPAGPSRRCRAGWRRSGGGRARGPADAIAQRVGLDEFEPAVGRALQLAGAGRRRACRLRWRRRGSPLRAAGRASGRPGPGRPRSRCPSSSGAAARAMRRVRLRSSRKCWPKRFFASRPCAAMVSRSGGKAATASTFSAGAGAPCRPPCRWPRSGWSDRRGRCRRCRAPCRDRARCARRAGRASR